MQHDTVSDLHVRSSIFTDPHLNKDSITPLSKAEEYAFKKDRRKLKNKISAQESRKRKKRHLENLEKRVRLLESENENLTRLVKEKDKSLRYFMHELKCDKSDFMWTEKHDKGTQTGTCLKCYLQNVSGQNQNGDVFTEESGNDDQIIFQREFLDDFSTRNYAPSEYIEFKSRLSTSRSIRDRA